MTRRLRIREVCPAILESAGEFIFNTSGNFWGYLGSPGAWTANRGWMPMNRTYGAMGRVTHTRPLGIALDAAADDLGGYEGVVHSFDTPIALKMGGVWIVPDVSYSTCTGRHQVNLYALGDVRHIPHDASAREILDVVRGYIHYDWATEKYSRGANVRPEARI